MLKYVLPILLLLSCADVSDTHRGGNGFVEKSSLLGSYCAPGCIWSNYAVSTGVQKLTHYCDGKGCACVVDGDIYSSCSLNNINEEIEENRQQSGLSNQYNLYKGNRIADEAYYEASRRNTYGRCFNAVADAVERITGTFLWGSHAYQAADQFASSPHFYEVSNYNIRYLPEGAVVVWGKGTSPSGHISVSLGDGREASDHIAQQMTYHYGGALARVFYPK